MPANDSQSIPAIGSFGYVFNEGVEGRDIFRDRADYVIFLSYLKDYLSEVTDPETLRTTFVVKGKSFRGLPRQPKNFLDRVELLAYRLRAGCFHLLVNELNPGSLEQFMRSLLTRYSIYFNKKYKRSGSLFSGSYKLFRPTTSQAVYLSYFLHRGSLDGKPDSVLKGFSSCSEYLGLRPSAWVKSGRILSSFQADEKENFKGVTNYQDFVEKYELSQEEKKALNAMIFEKLEGGPVAYQALETRVSEERFVDKAKNRWVSWPDMPALLTSISLFLVLFGLGVRNIWKVQARERVVLSSTISVPRDDSTTDSIVLDNPEVIVASDSAELKDSPDSSPLAVLRVKVKADLTDVNLRGGPSVRSEKVGTAIGGESFEFVAENDDWYEIKLADGSIGFVAASLTELLTENLEGID